MTSRTTRPARLVRGRAHRPITIGTSNSQAFGAGARGAEQEVGGKLAATVIGEGARPAGSSSSKATVID